MAGTAMAGGRISAVTMDLSLLEQILCYLYYHGLSSPSRMRCARMLRLRLRMRFIKPLRKLGWG